MSNDTIKRSDAIKALNREKSDWNCDYNVPIDNCIERLKKVKSTDRPQGEWVESFKRVEVKRGAYLGTKFVHDGWSCSECSEVVEKRYPNCPYCLARMKGADDEQIHRR